MTNAIVIGHAALPQALIETLSSIVGPAEGIVGISNKGLSSEKLLAAINAALDQFNPDESILFVDVPGGSCAISCMAIIRERKKVPVICGVNLLMLLEFYINRERYPRDQLAEFLVNKGKDSIRRVGG